MLYRIHDNLLVDSAKGLIIRGGEGCVSDLAGIGKDKIKILLGINAISLVHAAPLGEMLPGWKVRTERLDACGIDTIAFVEWEAEDICRAVMTMHEVRWSPAKVTEWQDKVKALLGIGQIALPSG